VGFLTLEQMWGAMLGQLTTTPASSEIGRLAQLLKAAGLTAKHQLVAAEGAEAGPDADVIDRLDAEPSALLPDDRLPPVKTATVDSAT
jgi:hypothetical protein